MSTTLSIIAGKANSPTTGAATSSLLSNPCGVAVDSTTGNVYIADTQNNVVEKIDTSGNLTIFAGIVGSSGPPTEGLATSSTLSNPSGVAVDSTTGNVYIADTYSNYILKVDPSGNLSIFAGTGVAGVPTAGRATKSKLNSPLDVAVDSTTGNVYIADTGNSTIEKVDTSGNLTIIAGIPAVSGAPTPGVATSSNLSNPSGVTIDSLGNIYISDTGNNVVEKVTSGTLSIFAGIVGKAGTPKAGIATESKLRRTFGITVDASRNVYISDTASSFILKVDTASVLSIVAGTGVPGSPTAGEAVLSNIFRPSGVAFDSTTGKLYIADTNNSLVEYVDTSGNLSIFAGIVNPSTAPTTGPATNSQLYQPSDIAIDSLGNIYVADRRNNLVEKIDTSGFLSIFAGTGTGGFPKAGPATKSRLLNPSGLAVDSSNNVYIVVNGSNVVVKVDTTGNLSIFAGTGKEGLPTPGPALSSNMKKPNGITIDTYNNVYIADTGNNMILKIDTTGNLSISRPSSST